MVKKFIAVVEGSLGLEEPWYVESAEFSDERQRIDIYGGIRPLSAFVCPVCGGAAVRDGYEPDEHFCKVATINHEVVDEKQRQMIEAAKRGTL